MWRWGSRAAIPLAVDEGRHIDIEHRTCGVMDQHAFLFDKDRDRVPRPQAETVGYGLDFQSGAGMKPEAFPHALGTTILPARSMVVLRGKW